MLKLNNKMDSESKSKNNTFTFIDFSINKKKSKKSKSSIWLKRNLAPIGDKLSTEPILPLKSDVFRFQANKEPCKKNLEIKLTIAINLPNFPLKIKKNNNDLIVDGENLLNDCKSKIDNK